MSDFKSDISAALLSDGPIPKEKVLDWIAGAADSDLSTLSKLYRLACNLHGSEHWLGAKRTLITWQEFLNGSAVQITNNADPPILSVR